MARYVGPKCRLCRREGAKLYLKGSRCLSEKCAITKRPHAPGQHGNWARGRVSDYGKHLREKQKVKRIYGILEAQFRRYYRRAAKVKGVTGQMLLQMLERRLDSVVYSAGLASSRNQARQLIRQGKFLVNGKIVNVPSVQLAIGDRVRPADNIEIMKSVEEIPSWLSWYKGKRELVVKKSPSRDDIGADINEQLIVEFYSR